MGDRWYLDAYKLHVDDDTQILNHRQKLAKPTKEEEVEEEAGREEELCRLRCNISQCCNLLACFDGHLPWHLLLQLK